MERIYYKLLWLCADSQANVTAAVVTPFVLLLILTTLVILAAVAAVKYFTETAAKSYVSISFSVEDKPGTLAKALKIFKVD